MMQQRYIGAVIGGIGLVAAGLWIAAAAAGMPIANPAQLWPLLLVLFGITLLAHYGSVERDQPSLVFAAVGLILSGLFICLFTLQIARISWRDMGRFWPVWMILFGAALAAYYVADSMRKRSLLTPIYLVGGAGLALLPLTLNLLPGTLLNQILRLGAIPLAVIILVGLFGTPAWQQDGQDQPPS